MSDPPRRRPVGHGPGEIWPFGTSGTTRNTPPGRITKPKTPTTPIKPAAAISDMLQELHANYRPQRSPVVTRMKSAQAGSQQQQQQQQPSTSIKGSSGKSTSPFLTSNTYAVLSDDNDDDDVIDVDQSDKDDQAKPAVTTSESKQQKQHKRQVPIVIPDYSGAAVCNLLSQKDCEFEAKILKSSVRITTLNRPMFEKVKTTLKEGNINHYTFDSAEKVPTKIVLTGYISVTVAQLMSVLAEHDIFPREARVLSRTESATGEHVLYLLLFDRGTVKVQDLRKFKSLDGFVVSWRYFTKRPTDAAQCHRCQRFGHGSRNCLMEPNCVKCGLNHLTAQCELPRKANLGNSAQQHKSKVKCVNCQENHTANFRGCTARTKYLETLDKQRKKPPSTQPLRPTMPTAQPAVTQRPANPPGWGRTYASVSAAGGSTTSPEVNADGDLFTLTEFLGLAREMFIRLRGCRNKGEQFLVLADLMGKYVTG